MRRSLIATLTLLAACGGGSGESDGSVVDAGPPDGGNIDAGALVTENCPDSYGVGEIAAVFRVPEEGGGTVGFDLDGDHPNGDPEVDNLLGSIGTLVAIINTSLEDSHAAGELRLLSEIRDFSGIGGDDTSVSVAAYGGVDSDDPANTADDFDGLEDYYYSHDSVYLETCEPKALLTGSFEGGVLDVSADSIGFYIESLGGFLEIKRARYQGGLETDGEGLRTPDGVPGLLGGVITQCSLNRAPPELLGYSLQHDLTRLFSLQPDVDLDGDGLETVQTLDNQTDIVSCTDGDGTTVVSGGDCGCAEGMNDGYSITFELHFRGATVLGPDPTP